MKYYTGVGSRSTPEHIGEMISDIAFKLANEGWTLRSGGAGGADSYFEHGAKQSGTGLYDIYIPWSGFSDLQRSKNHLVLGDYKTAKEAEDIASEVHPAWDKCSNGAKKLHSRNVFQVLGSGLYTPSKMLIAYAEPTKTGVKGGTNTAWMLAKMHDIPCFNLYTEEDFNRVQNWLRGKLNELD